jgi:protocatechuate 3,4-dioxygenase beta subunit
LTKKQPIIDRRTLVAGAGAVLAAGTTLRLVQAQSSTPAASAAGSPAAAACVLTPELTEGPYYVANELVRQDITEGKAGVPLTLKITVQHSTGCTPLANAAVDIWHCDALGYYSGITGENPGGGGTSVTTSKNATTTFLRGIQPTDDQGVATFQTIYSGWYTGRTVHIHLKVHVGGTEAKTYTGGHVAHTGQLFFDDTISDKVFALQPYATHTGTRTRNGEDNILGDHADEPGFLLDLTQTDASDLSQGFTGTIALGVDPNATPAATGPGGNGNQGGPGGPPPSQQGTPPA